MRKARVDKLGSGAADVRLHVNWHRLGRFGTSTSIFFHEPPLRLGRQKGKRDFSPSHFPHFNQLREPG